MVKVEANLEIEQIESAIRQLDEKDRWYLTKQLVSGEMDRVVQKLRRNVRRQNLSAKEIDRVIEKARMECYAESRS